MPASQPDEPGKQRFANPAWQRSQKRAKKRQKVHKLAKREHTVPEPPCPAPSTSKGPPLARSAVAKPPLFGKGPERPATPKGAKTSLQRDNRSDLHTYEKKFLPDQEENRKKGETRFPSAVQLRLGGFGRPDRDHSAVQEACAETSLFLVLKSGYLDDKSTCVLCQTNPLVGHLARTMTVLRSYDFGWLREPDTEWASQENIRDESKKAMLACLCHYNLDVSLLMRFLGGNYVGAHRDVEKTALVL